MVEELQTPCERALFRVGKVFEIIRRHGSAIFSIFWLFVFLVIFLSSLGIESEELANGAATGLDRATKSSEQEGFEKTSTLHPLFEEVGKNLRFVIRISQVAIKRQGSVDILTKEAHLDLW